MSAQVKACPTCGEWDRLRCALVVCPECGGAGYVDGVPEESAAEAVAKADIASDYQANLAKFGDTRTASTVTALNAIFPGFFGKGGAK